MKRFILLILGMHCSRAWAADLIEVKGPAEYPANYFWIYLLFGVLVILLFVFLKGVYKKLVQKEAKREAGPAWETAYQRLDHLQSQQFVEKGEWKKFYTGLCDILRWYCEEQFNIKAAEMTTQEFLESLQTSHAIDTEVQTLFRDFLESCDQVKFAKYTPGLPEAQQSFQLAKKIIDLTRNQSKVQSL